MSQLTFESCLTCSFCNEKYFHPFTVYYLFLKSKYVFAPHVHCSTFTISKAWKPCKRPSTDEWIKMWYIYNGISLSQEKSRIMPSAATWMVLETITWRLTAASAHSSREGSQRHAVRGIQKMNLPTKQKQTRRCGKGMHGYQKRKVGGIPAPPQPCQRSVLVGEPFSWMTRDSKL